MKQYAKLLRIKHYVKNILVFVPMFFNGSFFDPSKFLPALVGFLAFSLTCSAVYIFNDLRDAEKDRAHPTKCMRPIASGAISLKAARACLMVCILLSLAISLLTGAAASCIVIIIYLFLNIAYSCGLKNKPIVDVLILTMGFVLRIVYGAVASGVAVSGWLYLTVFSGALFLSLGKRRNEIRQRGQTGETREVLRLYTDSFLDKNMYVSLGLTIVFYALWAMAQNSLWMTGSVLLVVAIFMRYTLVLEGDSDGDPVEVVTHDTALLVLALSYVLYVGAVLYSKF